MKCWEDLLKEIMAHLKTNLKASKKPNTWQAKAHDTFLILLDIH